MKILELYIKNIILESESKKIIAYHGGSHPITKFNRKFSAMGVFWFSENKEKILNFESGAASVNYLMTAELTVTKTAGWTEYDKYFLQQLESWGYDSIHLYEDWVIFNPKNIRVIDIRKIK